MREVHPDGTLIRFARTAPCFSTTFNRRIKIMIRNPIDIASRVSPELSGLIETIINQLDTDEPVTLASVRSFIKHELPDEIDEDEHLHHFDIDESVIDELDELIEPFG